MNTWKIDFENDYLGLGKHLSFYQTTDIRGLKILPYQWFLRLDDNLKRQKHYRLLENVKSIYAPDKKEMSDALFIAFGERCEGVPEDLGDGYVISKNISKRIGTIGYLIGISTANEVGLFGIWPQYFYKVCRERLDIMTIAQLLLSDKPVFWKEVWVASKPGLIKKLGIT